jgi:hypothetical protein
LGGFGVDLIVTGFETGDVGKDVAETGNDAFCAFLILCIFTCNQINPNSIYFVILYRIQKIYTLIKIFLRIFEFKI